MLLLRRAIPVFTAMIFVASAAVVARSYSPAFHRQTVHAAIITVTPDGNKATLADFSWLAGRWEGKLGPMTAEQQWMAPKNGTMQGFFRLTDDQKTILIELFTLRETPDGIFLYFRHFSPELVPQEKDQAYRLKLGKRDASRFQFDNTVQNELKDAILIVIDADHYTSHGDLTDDDGKPAVIEVAYHRVK